MCPGLPGAGKSVISSIVTERLMHDRNKQHRLLAYIFCNYARQEQQDFGSLVKTLLRQLLEQQEDLPEIVNSCYREGRELKSQSILSSNAQDIFLQLVSGFEHAFIIVDAFDECKEATRRSLISFLRALNDAANTMESVRLSILITYRPGQDLQLLGDISQELVIRAERSDQLTYLAERLPELSMCASDKAVQDMILNEITNTADGMCDLSASFHR